MSYSKGVETHPDVQTGHHNTTQGCLTPTMIKVGVVVLGLMALGAGLVMYFLHVNAIAAYTVGGMGGFLILATAIASIIDCVSSESSGVRQSETQETVEEQNETQAPATIVQQEDPEETTREPQLTEETKSDTQQEIPPSSDNGTPPTSSTTFIPRVKKNPGEILKPIDFMLVRPITTTEHAGKRMRIMSLNVTLDDLLSSNEPDYLGYVNTLITCMQRLQNFDPNLVFVLTFHFDNPPFFKHGYEEQLQTFAKLVFSNLIEKYKGCQTPEDGTQKINLRGVLYAVDIHTVIEEWTYPKEVTSFDDLAKAITPENFKEATGKLENLMEKCVLYDPFARPASDPDREVRLRYYPEMPLSRIIEELDSRADCLLKSIA